MPLLCVGISVWNINFKLQINNYIIIRLHFKLFIGVYSSIQQFHVMDQNPIMAF